MSILLIILSLLGGLILSIIGLFFILLVSIKIACKTVKTIKEIC